MCVETVLYLLGSLLLRSWDLLWLTLRQSLILTDLRDNELSSASVLVDPLLDSSSTKEAPDAPSVEGIVTCVNESEDLSMHDDYGPSARVPTSDGSLPLPQSVVTEVLKEGLSFEVVVRVVVRVSLMPLLLPLTLPSLFLPPMLHPLRRSPVLSLLGCGKDPLI